MKSLNFVFVLSIALYVSFPVVCRATQVVLRTDQQLGKQATSVVRGTVASVRSFWNDSHTKIFTETMIAVDETYKGTNAGSVRILQLGGSVDGVQVTVSGALHWSAGEEVLLFLEPYFDGASQVSGFSQGKFHVERDPDSGQAFVRRPALGGAEFVSGSSGGVVAAPAEVEKVSLDRFVSRALGRR